MRESKYLGGRADLTVTANLKNDFEVVDQVIRTNLPDVGGAVMIAALQAFFAQLFELLFGCRHSRYSFPVSVRRATRRPQAAALTGMYVACLDCGKEFPYDWQEMKVVTSPERHRERVAELAKHAV